MNFTNIYNLACTALELPTSAMWISEQGAIDAQTRKNSNVDNCVRNVFYCRKNEFRNGELV